MSARSRVAANAALLALGLLALVVATAPAHAQIQGTCGDGIVNAGEDCDDGNLIAGDCCSPGCKFESAATVCRAPVDPCDAPEFCTGTSAVCPPDTGILGDTDGDGICDPLDDCPLVPDPLQVDTDKDGIGDLCDPCTELSGSVNAFHLRIRKLDHPLGQQRLKFRALLTVPSNPPIDPTSKGLRFVITDATHAHVLDVTIPPLPFDHGSRTGWVTLGTSSTPRWTFVDGADLVQGVDRATVRVQPGGNSSNGTTNLRVLIESGGNTTATVPQLPVTLSVVIDTPIAVDGQCAEVTPAENGCIFRNSAGKILCH
jgi:cysteine-rich repeat protein